MVGSARLSATSPRHLDGSSWGLVRGRRHTRGGESMSRIWLAGTSALALVTVCAALARAEDMSAKNSARIGDGKLLVKIKSGVTYSLADNGTQGNVNVQVQFGNGTRYCMRCSGNTKNDASKFLGKDCVAAPCDAEPTPCIPSATTTSTSTSTSTSTTCPTPTGTVVKASLVKTLGHFTYN